MSGAVLSNQNLKPESVVTRNYKKSQVINIETIKKAKSTSLLSLNF